MAPWDAEEYQRWIEQSEHTYLSATRDCEAHYLPARYPDAYPEGSPYKFYNRRRAETALEAARQLREWVKSVWDEASR